MTSNTNKKDTKSTKFDSAFEKYSSMLSKDYKDSFKKPDYAADSKKEKVKDSLRKGNAVVVTKTTNKNAHNTTTPQVNIAKALDPEHDIELKSIPKEISVQVQQARNNAGKSQEDLAKICEVKVSSIKDLESGTGMYDPTLVVKIEKALKVTFERSWKKKEK